MDGYNSDHSDHYLMLMAYNGYINAENRYSYCSSYYLSYNAMEMIEGIRQQLIDIMDDAGLNGNLLLHYYNYCYYYNYHNYNNYYYV